MGGPVMRRWAQCVCVRPGTSFNDDTGVELRLTSVFTNGESSFYCTKLTFQFLSELRVKTPQRVSAQREQERRAAPPDTQLTHKGSSHPDAEGLCYFGLSESKKTSVTFRRRLVSLTSDLQSPETAQFNTTGTLELCVSVLNSRGHLCASEDDLTSSEHTMSPQVVTH